MRRFKKIVAISMLIFYCFFATGCWNYRELNEMSIVAGIAVDKIDNKFLMTIEIVDVSNVKEGQPKSKIYTTEGNTVFDAVRKLISLSGRRLYWSHAKVIIISNKIKDKDLISLIDWINRDSESRSDMWMLVSGENTAKEIFEKTTKGIEPILSFYLADMIKNEKSLSTAVPVELWNFVNDITHINKESMLPVVSLTKNLDNIIPNINGMGLYKENKLIGYLTGEETKYLLFIINKFKAGIIPLKNIGEPKEGISLEIFKSKTKIKPKYINNKLTMDINININAGIAEVGTYTDFIKDKNKLNDLKFYAENYIRKRINMVISKLKNNLNVDVFKFYDILVKNMPELKKYLDSNWKEFYPKIDTNINVNINIIGSGKSSKPLK